MRETSPVTFTDEAPTDDTWRTVSEYRSADEVAAADAVYGEFPHGPSMLWAIRHGQAADLIEEADIRAGMWRLMVDQACVYAVSERVATWSDIGRWLGISRQAARKRYGALVAEVGGDPDAA